MNTVQTTVRILPNCTLRVGRARLLSGVFDLACVGFDNRMRGLFVLRNESINIDCSPSLAARLMRGNVRGVARYIAPRPDRLECMTHPNTDALTDLLRDVGAETSGS